MLRLMNAVTAGIFAAVSLFAADAGAVTLSKAKPVQTTSDVTSVIIMKDPPPQFRRRVVTLVTSEKPGTIIVDTNHKYLYHVLGNNKATRYGIGVGREGFGWSGVVKVARKAEWPGWTPPKEMIARERKKGHILPDYQDGGIDNPLGARALYLFGKKGDSGFRIHGTNQPWTIGLNMSSGCIRMMNKDVEHLYDRTPVGTRVIVVGPGNRQGKVEFADQGVDYFRDLFASFER